MGNDACTLSKLTSYNFAQTLIKNIEDIGRNIDENFPNDFGNRSDIKTVTITKFCNNLFEKLERFDNENELFNLSFSITGIEEDEIAGIKKEVIDIIITTILQYWNGYELDESSMTKGDESYSYLYEAALKHTTPILYH